MTEIEQTLTTAQYSAKTGLPVSTVARMLRQGKLRGEKRSGKWAIFDNQRHEPAEPPTVPADATGPAPGGDVRAADAKTYDVVSFARLTYLTETGVRRWLRSGRLSGRVDSGGVGQVDAANLERPELKHLIRE